MERVTGGRKRQDDPAYCAALYLLTANEDIYFRTANCFRGYGIAFDLASVKGISIHNYTLLAAAKDIYANGDRVTLNDLGVSELVDALAFRLIVNALLIVRSGNTGIREKGERK